MRLKGDCCRSGAPCFSTSLSRWILVLIVPQLYLACTAHLKVTCALNMDLEAHPAPSPPPSFAYNPTTVSDRGMGGSSSRGHGQRGQSCFLPQHVSVSQRPGDHDIKCGVPREPKGSVRFWKQNPGVEQNWSFSVTANAGICTFSGKKTKGKPGREKWCPKQHALQRWSCYLWKVKAATSQRQG